MPGGLLNLVATGTQNVILTGNPCKTFFKSTYAKYTNFGLQKFRVDFNGQRQLRLSEPSMFTFTMPRYGDMITDTYLVVDLPTIWSPVVPPGGGYETWTAPEDPDPITSLPAWRPYEFKWIEDLGTQLIRSVRFTVGAQIIQEYSGQYLKNLVERDFTAAKKKLYYEMTGNVPELNDPAAMFPGQGYPSVGQPYSRVGFQTSVTSCQGGPSPSIYGRRVYIPLNIWFTMASKMAFPLVSLQYAELVVEIECRPVQELFVIRDTAPGPWQVYADAVRRAQLGELDPLRRVKPPPYKAADFNNGMENFYRFLQPPPAWDPESPLPTLDIRKTTAYQDRRTVWAADVHLIVTYVFLTDEEVRVFAARPQKYLIRETYTRAFENITGPTRVWLENSMGMVASWMWFFQRTDVNLRNAWSNYTNWETKENPMVLWPGAAAAGVTGPLPALDTPGALTQTYTLVQTSPSDSAQYNASYPPAPSALPMLSPSVALCAPVAFLGPTRSLSAPATFAPAPAGRGLFVTPEYRAEFIRNIMQSWGLILDGKYRENVLDAGVFSQVSKYVASDGDAPDGLYCYNFALKTSPYDFQPSGAMNLSKFSRVEFELAIIQPPLDPSAQVTTICDASDNVIGVNKPVWQIYKYSYNLVVMEERYNVLSITSGMAALEWAR
jgi:hypothetical protein